MQHNSKYKVGDYVGVKVMPNVDHITYWKILKVISTPYGFKYQLNKSGTLCLKEKDILGLRPESERKICTCIGVDDEHPFVFHKKYEFKIDSYGNYLVYEMNDKFHKKMFKSRREFLMYFKRGELTN